MDSDEQLRRWALELVLSVGEPLDAEGIVRAAALFAGFVRPPLLVEPPKKVRGRPPLSMEAPKKVRCGYGTTPQSSDAAIIDAKGGGQAVSIALGFSRVRVQNWKVKGIPADHRPSVLALPDRALPDKRANLAKAKAAKAAKAASRIAQRDLGPPPDDAMRAEAERLWELGKSVSEIAAATGRNKNQTVGVLNRMTHLARRENPVRHP